MQQLKANSYGSRSNDQKMAHIGKGYKKPAKPKSSFLTTEVTTLDMNAMFQNSKKIGALKNMRQNAIPHCNSINSMTNGNFLSQTANYNMGVYNNPNAFLSNFEDIHELSSDLPSLMSVSTNGKSYPEQAYDFSNFSDEFAKILQSGYNSIRPSNSIDMNANLHMLGDFSSLGATNMQKMMSPTQTFSRANSGNSVGRKNRMVEVKTIDDGSSCRSVVVVSDPLSASAANRSTVVQLNNSRQVNATKSVNTPRISQEPLYSRKVFIGGLPIDVTEEEVWTTFGAFGRVLVDWPRRPENGRGDYFEVDVGRRNSRSVSGYVFLVFQNERSVQELVNSCQMFEQKFYLELSSPTMSDKAVQVRAWRLSDIDYFSDEMVPIDHRRTVFIGGVPRPTRACDLAKCLENLYGKVSYVGIDIDPELKYPKGAARVTFATAKSFVAAISGRFVQVIHSDTNKRVEIKPYVMEEQICDECEGKLCKLSYAPYFCGDQSCLQYYCEACWDRIHYEMSELRREHRPMVRTGDQTRILPRPPHHPPSTYHRHSATTLEQQSTIARIVSGTTRNPYVQSKPFSATPTQIGY